MDSYWAGEMAGCGELGKSTCYERLDKPGVAIGICNHNAGW